MTVRGRGIGIMEINHEKNRVFAKDESGNLLAEVTFPDCGDDRVIIERTFVAPEFRGQNIASQLMQAAYEEIRSQCRKALLRCPYAIKWFDRHTEARDILVVNQPGRKVSGDKT